MKYGDVEILPTEELRVLHQKVTTSLKAKIIAEKKVLEDRLSQPNGRFRWSRLAKLRSAGLVQLFFKKFRNPEQPSETWTGRRNKPRWLTAQLELGKQIDDFRIKLAAA
jgi:DNA-binding protein H-NS